jgi:hypothetical protein
MRCRPPLGRSRPHLRPALFPAPLYQLGLLGAGHILDDTVIEVGLVDPTADGPLRDGPQTVLAIPSGIVSCAPVDLPSASRTTRIRSALFRRRHDLAGRLKDRVAWSHVDRQDDGRSSRRVAARRLLRRRHGQRRRAAVHRHGRGLSAPPPTRPLAAGRLALGLLGMVSISLPSVRGADTHHSASPCCWSRSRYLRPWPKGRGNNRRVVPPRERSRTGRPLRAAAGACTRPWSLTARRATGSPRLSGVGHPAFGGRRGGRLRARPAAGRSRRAGRSGGSI